MSFLICGLEKSQFEHLFPLPAGELAKARAVRVRADRKPGFPCRVSLVHAEVGEELLLVHYEHHAVDSPYRASHAIYIRLDAREAKCKPGTIPDFLRLSTLSLRAFDADGMMLAANVTNGDVLEAELKRMLTDARAAYIHIHFAGAGCYAARAERAELV